MTLLRPAAAANLDPQSRAKLGLYLAGSLLAVAAEHLLRGRHEALLVFAFFGVCIAVWHGAFDGALAAEDLPERLGRWWLPLFGAGYLLLVGAVLLLWWQAPFAALGLFLLYSAWHFGTERLQHLSPVTAIFGLAAGVLPIAAACAWHADEVTAIFGSMLHGAAAPQAAAQHLTALGASLLWPGVAMLLTGTLIGKSRSEGLVELLYLGVTLLLFRFCSPMVAFAVFFCLWHTPEHLIATSGDAQGHLSASVLRRHLRAGIVPWIVALAGIGALCFFAPHTVLAYLAELFVGLSALTVPHMLLGEWLRGGAGRAAASPLPA